MTTPRVNLPRLYQFMAARAEIVAEHGADAYAAMLRDKLAKLDRELKPTEDRHYKLSAARKAVQVELTAIVNGAEK